MIAERNMAVSKYCGRFESAPHNPNAANGKPNVQGRPPVTLSRKVPLGSISIRVSKNPPIPAICLLQSVMIRVNSASRKYGSNLLNSIGSTRVADNWYNNTYPGGKWMEVSMLGRVGSVMS